MYTRNIGEEAHTIQPIKNFLGNNKYLILKTKDYLNNIYAGGG